MTVTVPVSIGWRLVLPLAVAVALGLGSLLAIPHVALPFELLVVAVTLAESLSPIVEWLARRVRLGLAIALVYIALALVVGFVGWLVIPPLVAQARSLVERGPTLLSSIESSLTRWDQLTGGRLSGLISALPGRLGGILVQVPTAILAGLFDLLLVIFLSVYWLAGSSRIKDFTLSLFRPRYRAEAAVVLADMGHNMGGYVRGTVINAFIMGTLAWLGLMLIQVPFALVLGVLTMAGELVPIIGPVVVGGIVAIIALTHSLGLALLAVALYTALIQLEGHVLTPNVMRRETNVPQTLVLLALVVGAGAGGLLGMVVAVPIAAALRVLVVEVVAPWERRLAGAEPRWPGSSPRREP